MNDDTWNPTPPGWYPVVQVKPRSGGEQEWRMTKDGHTMICELFNEERSGASWEVVLKHDGKWLFGRRCPDAGFARFVASGMKQDHLHGGWIESKGDAR